MKRSDSALESACNKLRQRKLRKLALLFVNMNKCADAVAERVHLLREANKGAVAKQKLRRYVRE